MEENVLVIKHGALGDFVVASGRMHTVRERHPNAHIALVTERSLVGLARSMGYFDEIVEDPRDYTRHGWSRIHFARWLHCASSC